jgi:hypothetical protein
MDSHPVQLGQTPATCTCYSSVAASFHCRRGAIAPISCDGAHGMWRQSMQSTVDSAWRCDGKHDVQQAHLKLLACNWRDSRFGGKRTWGMHMNAPSRRENLGKAPTRSRVYGTPAISKSITFTRQQFVRPDKGKTPFREVQDDRRMRPKPTIA